LPFVVGGNYFVGPILFLIAFFNFKDFENFSRNLY